MNRSLKSRSATGSIAPRMVRFPIKESRTIEEVEGAVKNLKKENGT